MKLILAVIRDTDDTAVTGALVNSGYRVTRVSSTGGFLRRGNVTLMIGVEEADVQPVMELIQKSAGQPEQPGQSRATLFVLNSPGYKQI